MKAIWVQEDVHERLKVASAKTGRSMPKIVAMLVTKELNTINDPAKLSKLFEMVKEEKDD